MDFVVEPSNQTNIDKLEKMQEKGLRLAEFQLPEKKKEMSTLKNVFGIEDPKTRRKSLEANVYSKIISCNYKYMENSLK